MPYLIDGHNLIPRAGLSLQDMEDELALVAQVQVFCRVGRRKAEIYFDGAPPGQAGTRRMGLVTAHFIRENSSADAAIEARLRKLGNAARNWSVVSSDGRVQAAARAARATVIPSDIFAGQLREALRAAPPGDAETGPGQGEVDEWLRLFGGE